jgi:hypothetical protein
MGETNKMNVLFKCLFSIGSATLLICPSGCAPDANAKALRKIDIEARRQDATQQARERGAHLTPALTALGQGDYSLARKRFEQLEAQGVGRFGRQRVRCLLAEGEIAEGMRLLSSLLPEDTSAVERRDLQVAFAIKGGREADLVAALENVRELPSFDSAPDGRDAVHPSPSISDRLMAVAVDFGRKYDRETLHLVGSEALRRGGVNPSALAEYASVTASNGDLRKAKALYQQVLTYKTSTMLRTHATGMIYDLNNIIALAERDHPIEIEEQNRRAKCRSTFFLASWN